MKKYIGITMYLVGLVSLSYLFFLNSKQNNNSIKNNNNEILSNKTGNIQNINSENKKNENIEKIENNNEIVSNKTGNIQSINNEIKKSENIEKIENKTGENLIDKELENKTIEIKPIENKINTGTTINKQNKNTDLNSEEELPEFLFIGLTQFDLQKDTSYEEIYNIINIKGKGIYKAENKEIYIKPLDNKDYNIIKNKIKEILNKIGGNMVETNLFGDKQTFINPEIYYKKQVIMLINFEKKNYLVVLPYSQYQNYKIFMKEKIFSE